MTDDRLKALSALRFNWAPVPDDVWRHSPFHVEGLHRSIEQAVLRSLEAAGDSDAGSPIGLILQGQRGAGKTHLLGWVREQVHAQQGYFFLVSLLSATDFWSSIVGSLNEGLSRRVEGGDSQLRLLLRSLATKTGVPRSVRRSVTGDTPLSREALDVFIDHLRAFDDLVGRECQETARALVLLASDDAAVREIGETFLQSVEDDHDERPSWGLRRSPRQAERIVRDMSWLLALTGPAVIAVDQIDTLIAQSVKTLRGEGRDDWAQDVMLEQIAGGLMQLREKTRRTLTIVACLPDSWQLIKLRATDTVQDRFREATQLKTIPTNEIGRELVERRFAVDFATVGFTPPYPTWPVRASAFDDAPGHTPRQLLIEIDRHVQACVLDAEPREMERFGIQSSVEPVSHSTPPPVAAEPELTLLDARFVELKASVDMVSPLDQELEDGEMPGLISAGLTAWIVERGPAGQVFTQDPQPGAKPALHARLRRVLDESTEDQVHWGFRAIAAGNPIAALNRLRAASTAAGLTADIPKRKLFVLRNAAWSAGSKTQATLDAFAKSGGVTMEVGEEDVRTLGALRVLLAENPSNLQAWLVARQPAGDIKIFREALACAAGDVWGDGPPDPDPAPHGIAGHLDAYAGSKSPGHRTAALLIGRTFDDGREARIDLEALRKHVAIFAGSGSGKTVLIRRLVEGCALQGVSAIVLDPNNDLARLGDAWPQAPTEWGTGDADLAARYLADTDVLIWTPSRKAGRPLSFQPLPDFGSVLDDADEFNEAVEAAVASIVPRAKLDGRTGKAHLGQAVLRTAVRYYGRRGGNRLKGLIDLLAELPDGVSELDNAGKIASELAQTLTAAMVNDPLFGGEGAPVDPGLLLTPPPGKRARISVISFIGLSSDEARQGFVNQLQMALFAWIKKHPAGDRPLGGLFVMDEAQTLAPSGAMTACTQSTLALASQARKYGLGLVFATQAPKGLHNRIPGNAATQFFGLLNAPIQIAAAQEMAAAKGGDVPDISRLRSGEFYAAVEGAAFEKVRTPLCLSHHPKSPLTTEEVIERAHHGGAGPALVRQ